VNTEELDYYLQLQAQINSLVAWRLEGSVGRAMMDAIQGGHCMLGFDSTRDFWGSYIPARDEVQAGTVGSYSYVVAQHGVDYAERLADVPEDSLLKVMG